MRLIDADAFWKHFEEGKAQLLLIKSMLPLEIIDLTLKIYAEIKEMIDSMPTIDPEPHWIPCSERLPEPRIDVWCNSDLGQMLGYYDETIEAWYGRDFLELLVNAWMPLPSPYQPEEESE